MLIRTNDANKLITIWLSKNDNIDTQHITLLENTLLSCKPGGYHVVIFHSGNNDLYDNTIDLLKHNRESFHNKSHENLLL